MNCNAAGCKHGRYEETSNEMRGLLIEVCREKEHSTALAQLTSHISVVVGLVRELARTPLQGYKILSQARTAG